jgi:hypothetical protein
MKNGSAGQLQDVGSGLSGAQDIRGNGIRGNCGRLACNFVKLR